MTDRADRRRGGRSAMSPRRLRRILAAYGASPLRWPAAERDTALALVRQRLAGERDLSEAARLDHALDAYGAAQAAPAILGPSYAPSMLRARNGAAEPPGRRGTGRRRAVTAGLRPAVLAGAVLAGLVFGVLLPHKPPLTAGVLERIPAATVSGAQAEGLAVAVLDTSE